MNVVDRHTYDRIEHSQLQSAAIELYRKAGCRLVREAIVADATNKTVGGGIRRFYFEKALN